MHFTKPLKLIIKQNNKMKQIFGIISYNTTVLRQNQSLNLCAVEWHSNIVTAP